MLVVLRPIGRQQVHVFGLLRVVYAKSLEAREQTNPFLSKFVEQTLLRLKICGTNTFEKFKCEAFFFKSYFILEDQ